MCQQAYLINTLKRVEDPNYLLRQILNNRPPSPFEEVESLFRELLHGYERIGRGND